MALSQKQKDANLRAKFMEIFKNALAQYDAELELLPTGTGSFSIPTLDEESFERAVKVTVEIPTGERGGDPYDPYEDSAAWLEKVKQKAEAAKEKEEAKAKKIANDEKVRAAKKAAKEAEQE